MIKLYNYLSRQRRAYFFFSLNFVSQRMRKEKKISRIRCLKIGLLGRKIGFYEAHPRQIARSCIHFFPRSRSAEQIFLGIIARDVRRFVSSLPLASSFVYLRIAHARDHSAHVFHRGEDGFSPLFPGKSGSRWRTAPACGLPRSLVISREIVFGAPEQFRDPPRVSENILPSKFTRKSTSSSPLFFFLERNCLLYLIRRDGTSSISSKLVSRWYTNHAYGNVFSWDIARGRSHVGE